MTIHEAIRKRRSIRKYEKGVKLPEEHIHALLEAAMMAPSACNTRPWEFTVVESEEKKAEIVKAHPFCRHLSEASLAIVVSARPEAQKGIAEGFFPQDCGAAIENILLEAAGLGYGSCWCGVYPHMSRCKVIADIIGTTATPVAIVVVGVPKESPEARGYYDESRVTRI
ncbi:MAG: nitroreductase family protein [Clostridia bacterium]|nr:nitroreductase family protein [Clostridia bacterium]